MSEPKIFTVTDIERYYRGEMTAAEMHRLEKAAMDDPILADMLDGYRHTVKPSADLLHLQQRLQQRIGSDERKGASIYRMQWLKIAALFLLFAGAGWIVLQTLSGKHEVSTIASTNDAPKKKAFTATTDSTAGPVQTLAGMESTDSLTKTDQATAAQTRIAKRPVPSRSFVNNSPTGDKETTESRQGYTALAAPLQQKIENRDSAVGFMTQADAATSARMQPDSVKKLNITMQPVAVPMEEVVIAKRKQQPLSNRRSILDTLKPENGWEAFDDYVAENIQLPEDIGETPTDKREVELSFNVDKAGNPRNITITKSMCEKCDTEAIRLIKKGPKWKGKKGTVKIMFPQLP